jgi:hypothetical protein
MPLYKIPRQRKLWKGENMNKKTLIPIFTLAILAASIATANAKIACSIQVKDINGNNISGGTVNINTVAYVSGHYEDQDGNSPANAVMEVYYNDGTGLKLEATLFTGNINDGDTITGTPFTLSKLGQYEFRWSCQKGTPGTPDGTSCSERTQARTTIQLVVPEPATIVGLLMALSAFGILAFKRTRMKQLPS